MLLQSSGLGRGGLRGLVFLGAEHGVLPGAEHGVLHGAPWGLRYGDSGGHSPHRHNPSDPLCPW